MNLRIIITIASKALVRLLGLLALGLIVYLIFLPLYPYAKLYFLPPQTLNYETATTTTGASKSETPQKSGDRIIIPKIGVNAPIIESKNEKDGLNRGAWRLPDSSTPDKGGNTVITGHRFKYLPPNNLTFFLLNKLVKGDRIQINWQGKVYDYLVDSTKIVPAAETSILAPSAEPLLTIFTCDPIFSTKNRLVVLARPN